MTKRIAYFGSCWPTNIGNAFVNLGAKHSLKKALGDRFQLIHFGGMSSYLFRKRNLPQNNLNLAKMTKCDYVVMAGMTQCIDHFQSAENIIKEFIDCGARVVIAGGGAQNYDDDEVVAVRNYMSELPIYVFVSRDTYSFQKYGDLAAHSFDGIDSAFFIADSECEMIPLELSEFDVLTFDQMDEPALINVGDSERIEAVNQSFDDSNQRDGTTPSLGKLRRLLGQKSESTRRTPKKQTIDLEGRMALRAHHSVWPDFLKKIYFELPNTLISDLPSDYLSLYARAHTVYSDRVHACIAALAYGRRAMLFGRRVPRLRMFQRLDAGEILERPVLLDREKLETEKRKQVEFFARVIE